jgi:hypothetical protein
MAAADIDEVDVSGHTKQVTTYHRAGIQLSLCLPHKQKMGTQIDCFCPIWMVEYQLATQLWVRACPLCGHILEPTEYLMTLDKDGWYLLFRNAVGDGKPIRGLSYRSSHVRFFALLREKCSMPDNGVDGTYCNIINLLRHSVFERNHVAILKALYITPELTEDSAIALLKLIVASVMKTRSYESLQGDIAAAEIALHAAVAAAATAAQ